MINQDSKKNAIAYLKNVKPRSSGHIVHCLDEFIDGFVAKLDYQENSINETKWIIITAKHKSYADSESQLIQQMNIASIKNSEKISWINQVFNIGGLIALILVGVSAYLVVYKPDQQVPEFIKTILLTVIGFYFGGFMQKTGERKIKSNSQE